MCKDVTTEAELDPQFILEIRVHSLGYGLQETKEVRNLVGLIVNGVHFFCEGFGTECVTVARSVTFSSRTYTMRHFRLLWTMFRFMYGISVMMGDN